MATDQMRARGTDGATAAEQADFDRALLAIASLDWREPRDAEPVRHEEGVAPAGYFEGLPPHVALLDDGRTARLLTPLTFVHPTWAPWPVPAGTEVNGASIPRAFWTLIGGPFEGRYRNASIVHDHYCVLQDRPWRDVHRMFHEAMLAGGVTPAKAKIMYYAVYRFGPRWAAHGGATESLVIAESPPPLLASDAESAARDAEAIYLNDLNLDEIEALADARINEEPSEAALEGIEEGTPSPAALARARRLVIVGGSGGAADHQAVAAQAAFLPEYLMDRFEKTGVRLVACRNSVTDFERDLRGVVPRGWEQTGKTWDSVPGAFFPDKRRVVVATIDAGAQRVVPTKSTRLHGSVDLVVHEAFHGYDYIGGHAVLRDQRYLDARIADLRKLSAYEQQNGQAGLEETFAESGARFAVEHLLMRTQLPSLFRYWSDGPETGAITGVPLESMQEPDAPIGVARLTQAGAIELDLRAEGPGGAIGHGWFVLEADEPGHAEMKSRLFGDTEPLEALHEREVLVCP